MSQKIEVLIKRQIYISDNYYSVYLASLNDKTQKQLMCVGYVPELEIDTLYYLLGEYIEHPKYGMQFRIDGFQRVVATSKEQMIKYLSGPLFPGIGKVKAEKIIEHYGESFFKDISEDETFIFTDQFLSFENKQTLIEQLVNQKELEKQINFLAQHGITLRQSMKIESVYGKEAIEKISENPYRMIDEIDGIGFKTCDKLAQSLGFDLKHPLRIEAILVYEVLQDCLLTGSTYTSLERVTSRVNRYKVEPELFNNALMTTLDQKRLIMEDENSLYHKSQYEAEIICANYFKSVPRQSIVDYDIDFKKYLTGYEKDQGIKYDESQKEAILNFFTNDKSIITGGPGTGKTTIIQAIIGLFRIIYPHYHLAVCAPTGRAAKRLKEMVNVDVTTIHSLLEWNLETNTFNRNEANPVLADLLIIDEFSMVDNYVMSALCLATFNVKKILFIGDKDQLPSVGPGFLIRDCMDSGLFKVSTLKNNYRQESGSNIVTLAQHINQGQFNETDLSQDVFHLETQKNIKDLVVKIVLDALSKGYTINDIQVLACKYDGSDGIDQMNFTLQQAINPKDDYKRELKFGYQTFREGDKVLQLKNQPEDFVFNGDVGIIVEIIYKAESDNNKDTIIVDFDGNFVEYDNETIINLKHAYCMSVHKAQGSEYPIVLFIVSHQHRFMLNKRLIYTAITRAKNSLIMIGSKRLLQECILIDTSSAINTKLVERCK